MRRVFVGVGLLVAFQVGLGAGSAMAAWPKGSDPSSNYAPHIPASCASAPTGTSCLKGGLSYLDKARGHLHQATYKLPSDFLKLPADKQVFILTNLDRGLYKLSPIAGVTNELNQDAWAGVHSDADPFSNDPHFQYFTSNWAYGYPNVLFAYGSWMYDDGPGSPTIDCRPPQKISGCWGHRHDILWELPKQYASGPTAMGAAAGKDHHGVRSYAMLLGRGDGGYKPTYLFKWSDHKNWW
jgi:hypothetical protein